MAPGRFTEPQPTRHQPLFRRAAYAARRSLFRLMDHACRLDFPAPGFFHLDKQSTDSLESPLSLKDGPYTPRPALKSVYAARRLPDHNTPPCRLIKCGPIAQLEEPPAHNRLVPGSSPGGPTIFHLTWGWFYSGGWFCSGCSLCSGGRPGGAPAGFRVGWSMARGPCGPQWLKKSMQHS